VAGKVEAGKEVVGKVVAGKVAAIVASMGLDITPRPGTHQQARKRLRP